MARRPPSLPPSPSLLAAASFDIISIAILVLMSLAFIVPFTPLPSHMAPALNFLLGIPTTPAAPTQLAATQPGHSHQERAAGYIDASGQYLYIMASCGYLMHIMSCDIM
jgi:hypothetical protein